MQRAHALCSDQFTQAENSPFSFYHLLLITMHLARLTIKIQNKITKKSGLPKVAPLFAHTLLGPMLIKEVSYFQALTTWPTTDWSLFSKQCRTIYQILHLAVNIYPWPRLPGQSLRGCNIYPWPYSPCVQAACSDSLPGWVCRVMLNCHWSAIL